MRSLFRIVTKHIGKYFFYFGAKIFIVWRIKWYIVLKNRANNQLQEKFFLCFLKIIDRFK